MRGLTISAHGGLDRIELRDDLPVPELTSDTDVRVRIRSAAINHLDLFVVGGLLLLAGTPEAAMGINALSYLIAAGIYPRVRTRSHGDAAATNPSRP